MKFLAIFLIAVCAGEIVSSSSQQRPGQGKIVGGNGVAIIEAPYQLQLEVDGWQICGASIIDRFFALTSARCVSGQNQRQLTLRAGTDRLAYGGHQYQVYRINIHPSYDEYYKDYDVAVLELATPFRLDDTTQTVPLATSEPESGSMVRATGWGDTAEEGSTSLQLQAVEIPVIPRLNCTSIYAGDVTLRMICAGVKGQDACQGDTGGPLVQGNVQVGVTSWSYGCARDGYPGVYTNLANPEIRSFINGIVSGSRN